MKEHGISIIIADSMEEVHEIRKILGVSEVFALRSIEQVIFVDKDTVFYSVLRTRREMDALVEYLNIKRGVISSNGRRENIGFNVDWVKRMLAPKKEPAKKMPLGISIPMDEDREDPFMSLGYVR